MSRKTPHEIADAANRHSIDNADRLIYASRTSAKVDSAAVQDGFQIYHHTFLFTPKGEWCVVQQGMNEEAGWARRYHWLGERVDDFVCEPHDAIHNLGNSDAPSSQTQPRQRQLTLLNMVDRDADANRDATAKLVRQNPDWLLEELKRCTEGPTLFAPARHRLLPRDVNSNRLRKIIISAHEQHPDGFEALLGTSGVGPATVRSLSLLAELIYDAPTSRRDPAMADQRDGQTEARRWADYAYAHGGKDGTPFPVDRATYDRNIEVLIDAVRKARVGENEKVEALKRLVDHSRDTGKGRIA